MRKKFTFQKTSHKTQTVNHLITYDDLSFDIKSSPALKYHSDSTEEEGIE